MRNFLFICSLLLTTPIFASKEAANNTAQEVTSQRKGITKTASIKKLRKFTDNDCTQQNNTSLNTFSKLDSSFQASSSGLNVDNENVENPNNSGEKDTINNCQSNEEVDYKAKLQTMAIYVLIFIVAILLLTYFLKKFSSHNIASQNASMNLKILEKRVISPKSALYLVELEGCKVLVGESQVELTMHSMNSSSQTCVQSSD